MTEYVIEFVGSLEMTEAGSPSSVTAGLRPNLFAAGVFFPCAVTNTEPATGIVAEGEVTIAGLCRSEDLDFLSVGSRFELRAGPSRRFAKGVIQTVISREIYVSGSS